VVINLGSMQITMTGLAIAALTGIVMNAVLPEKDYEFGANATGDQAVNFGYREK
jgi:uracil permease